MNNYKNKNSICSILSKNIYVEEVCRKENNRIFFVLDPDKPSWVFVNEDGLEILNLCNGKNSIEKISQEIADKFHKKYKDSFEIVSSFLNDIKNYHILYEEFYTETSKNKFRGIALEITKKCNLRCIHCYLCAGNASNNELKLSEVL